MTQKMISIVVPVFNEEGNIRNFYDRMSAAVAKLPYATELVFVNDGSRDNSLNILKELAESDKRVTVINLSRNFGSYAALNAGWETARGDAIMSISADLQDPPEIIHEFLPHWEAGNDIVWGVRAGREDPFFKALFAGMFYIALRKLALPDFPKDGMDIGLFSRHIIEKYLALKEQNSIPFVTIFAMGFRQIRVPYRRVARVAGTSGWPFWKRLKFAVDVLVDHSYVPIRLMTLSGVVIAGLSFLYGLLLVLLKVFFGYGGPGWTSLATLITFMGGIQMLFLGLIAEYVWRTNRDVKSYPSYYIMDIFSSRHS